MIEKTEILTMHGLKKIGIKNGILQVIVRLK